MFAVLQFAVFYLAKAQINEDFSDGDLSSSPVWTGDTAHFVVTAGQQLRLTAPEKGQSYIATPSEAIDSAEWRFYVKMAFNPSSNNYVDVYLVSDKENLTEPLNGYFVKVGNTPDEVSLYRQSGGPWDAVKIIDGQDDRVDMSTVELYVKVMKNGHKWELLTDVGADGNFVQEGTVVDSAHVFSKYFGIVCHYTSTRTDKFFFDDITVAGKAYKDDLPPGIDSVRVLSDSSLWLRFNEKITISSATKIVNYSLDHSIGNPSAVTMQGDSAVQLIFGGKLKDMMEYTLSVSGVEDWFSNKMEPATVTFIFLAPYTPQFGDLIITEVMADPVPSVGLPEYEFLEIFNTTARPLIVHNLILVAGKDTAIVPDFLIKSHEYIILCGNAALPYLSPFGKALKVPRWPTLNNRGEAVALYNEAGNILFSMEYDDSWYRSIDKDDGGWSLEMMDTHFPCMGQGNWTASADPSGGTPGRANAARKELTDLTAPEIVSVGAVSDTSVLIHLSEKIPPQAMEMVEMFTEPEIAIKSMTLAVPELHEIWAYFDGKILGGGLYTLTISGLRDCPGNMREETKGTFVLPEEADSLDIIINEILFDPLPGGVDFVELYNRSEKYIDLKNWLIANEKEAIIAEGPLILQPQEFLVLTPDREVLINQYPHAVAKTIREMSELPPFNNDEGDVLLKDAQANIIDFFHYDSDYHAAFLRDEEGVSLERIDPEGPSNDPANWHSAASVAGNATPGYKNSQFMQGDTDEKITVEPPVFDPGSPGTDSYAMIKCRFPQAGNMVSISIVDAAGRKVKTIASHISAGTAVDFKWEGDNDAGAEVRMGPYIVFVEVYNIDGMKNIYRKKVVVAGRF